MRTTIREKALLWLNGLPIALYLAAVLQGALAPLSPLGLAVALGLVLILAVSLLGATARLGQRSLRRSPGQ